MDDLLLVYHCKHSCICYRFQANNWMLKNIMTLKSRGHARTLKIIPFENLGTVFYLYSNYDRFDTINERDSQPANEWVSEWVRCEFYEDEPIQQGIGIDRKLVAH